MKMKIAVLIGIALCAMLLISPALANSANSNILEIYGNANEDDTIDMRDLTYVKLIFFGKKPVTELADAKYDGKINPLDFIQIKLIIVGKEKEITIVDTADRIVTVKKPVEKVVELNPGLLETIRSLDAPDKIIGVDMGTATKEDIFFPEFQDYPIVGSAGSPDIEEILNLHPGVVFSYASSYKSACEDMQDKLKKADPNIAVVRFDSYKPLSYVEEVRKMGYIFGKRDEAEEFIDFYEGYMNIIKERVEKLSEEDKPKVYFELWKPYRAAGGGSGYQQKVLAAGGNNIFSDLPAYPTVDPEEVLNRDPEIIVKYYKSGRNWRPYDANELIKVRNELMERPELEQVSAVKNRKVYVITNTVIRGGFCIGVGYLAKWFHPELFSDFNPQAIHQEYLTRFQGLDIDLDEYGVFVYPEPS